ncbi:hypothetical protein [Chelativorans sp.]|nr:hypothetical protein [Chelativorans sp.]
MMSCLVAAACGFAAGILLLAGHALYLRRRFRRPADQFLAREDHWGGV